MKAVPAQTIGSYVERPVPPRLAGIFACVWRHDLPETDGGPITITPDATIDLQWIGGQVRIAGPDRDPKVEYLPAGSRVIGFRFHPGVAAAWLGIPAKEIRGERLALEDLWGRKAVPLVRDMSMGLDGADMVRDIERRLLMLAAPNAPQDRAMRFAYDLIDRGVPTEIPLIPYLTRALGLSERSLRRRFDNCYGYGPKTLDRILRFQRFRRLAANEKDVSFARLAAEAGYADQSHLIRDCRRLTGSVPSALPCRSNAA